MRTSTIIAKILLLIVVIIVVLSHDSNLAYADINSGLTGYWSYDGKNVNWRTNVATDTSAFSRNLSLTGISTTSAPIAGKKGQALYYDGVNDIATNATALSSFISSSDSTISVWLKPTTLGTASANVFNLNGIANDSGLFFGLFKGTIGGLDRIWGYNWDGSEDKLGITYTPNQWVHVVLVHSGGQLYIYKNGVLDSSTASGNTTTLTGTLVVGRNGSLSQFYQGGMDELRIYNRALTQSEIDLLYNAGESKLNISGGSTSNSRLRNGLVGHWTFDGKNINWNSNVLTEVSTSSRTAQLYNFSTTSSPVAGVMGQTLKFDGVTTYASTTLSFETLRAQTISAWVWLDDVSGNKTIYDHEDHSVLRIENDEIDWFWSGGDFHVTASANLLPQKWYHIIATYDGVAGAPGENVHIYVNGSPVSLVDNNETSSITIINKHVNIGRSSTGASYYKGKIDDVRIYNRVINDNERVELYKYGIERIGKNSNQIAKSENPNLIGHWTFNGPNINWTTGAISDISGNAIHGSAIGLSTTTTPVPGKLGQAIKFLGSEGNGVQLTTLSNTGKTYTFSFWVNLRSANGGGLSSSYFFDSSSGRFILSNENCGSNRLCFYDGTWKTLSSATFPLKKWTHVVYVFNNSSGIALGYINGEFVGSTSYTGTNLGANTCIGGFNNCRTASGAIDGSIDDFRIYSSVLSTTTIQQLYKSGSATLR